MSMNQKLPSPFSYNLIYIYEIPDESHKNCLKIGRASLDSNKDFDINENNTQELNESAKARIRQQTGTAGIKYILKHTEIAIKEEIKNGKKEKVSFIDDDVHEVLINSGIKRVKFDIDANPREWFNVNLTTAINAIKAVKAGRKSLNNSEINTDFCGITLYPNQESAVSKTLTTFKSSNSMLWDAKMRFGKTITALELVKRLNKKPETYGDIKKVIIATHRPEVIEQWYGDFKTIFYEKDSAWKFGSKVKGFGLQFNDLMKETDTFVYFASLQDLRGAKLIGGIHDKNQEIYDTKWDLLIIDEAHEGTLTDLGENVFKELIDDSKDHKTKVLRLSGTPFNIIDQYTDKEIYSWSYIDEQEAKENWDYLLNPKNPYAKMPKMNVFTYDLGTIVNNPHYLDDKMFNFGEFFRVWTGKPEEDIDDDGSFVTVSKDKIGKFVHEKDIINFLNLLSTQDESNNYPFSTKEYQEYFKHTLWMVPGVKEASALSELLNKHKVFGNGNFYIVNVAGDGDEIEESNEDSIKKTKRALDKVKNAINTHERTITLSCQRLTTGVTVPEWTAVFMLYGSSNVAAQRYMQTIFRVQSPANINGRIKENAFVFEFAPDRALKVLAKTAHMTHQAGKVNSPETKALMTKLLQFCPVIAINGSQMNYYNVPMMIKQLKSAYIDDIVDSGFENKRIYNLEQLKLENLNVNDFAGFDDILKGSSSSGKTKLIKIVDNDLDKKEQTKTSVKDKQPKSEEEKQYEKQAKNAIRILNAIMTKVPLMVYGLTFNENKTITYDDFPNLIDDASWVEFMPKDATKEKFRLFKKYIDIEMFELCNEELRNQVNSANKLSINERIKRLTPLFLKFKNPDKETVLTPWRVVNMHLGQCFGGYNFYNDNYNVVLDEPRFVDKGLITNQVFKNPDVKILEINSKTGLYPLYVTYSVFRYKTTNNIHFKTDKQLWKDTVENNIFVVCRTKMAEYITKRTLIGDDKNTKTNILTIENMINSLKDNPENVISKIKNKSEWNRVEGGIMKFDVVVGNPPYQENVANRSEQPPVYHLFYNTAFTLAPKVSLITPARFLFDAGKTPKAWNAKMLNDKHFRVIQYEENSRNIFPSVEIKGGVAITYRDINVEYEPIKMFVKINTLGEIVNRVRKQTSHYLNSITYSNTSYKYSKLFIDENSHYFEKDENGNAILSGGSARYLASSAFEKIPEVFYDCVDNENNFIKIIGRKNNHRAEYFIKKSYISPPNNFDKYKVFISSSNGTGVFGETLTPPFVGLPYVGSTETFLTLGKFDTVGESENLIKYIKTKFARALLGSLKVTQGNKNANVWANIPLQDFTSNSDIDWSKSISEIDRQLYKKYKLSEDEIKFIESTVKSME